ncbi:MAG: sulfate adenylyltransferase [Planctomycetota bacterium]
MIPAHGGRLIDRVVRGEEREALLSRISGLQKLQLNEREASDLELIATGGFSPIEGFMTKKDYEGVRDRMRLANDLPWSLPVTLAVKHGDETKYEPGSELALVDVDGKVIGVLELEDVYQVDHQDEAQKVLRTTDEAHPGVDYLESITNTYLGGRVSMVERRAHTQFNDYRLDPKESRVLFKQKGWKRIVAFQTRNPIHRAHEYIQKCALEMVDGLLIHPLMGKTKGDDIPEGIRFDCYNALISKYFPKDRVSMSIFPAAMRYAGPREAIFHALVRKNYGCTHFIVGRDHAGVGNYYGTYDAQLIFDEFEPGEIGITPMMFEHAFFDLKSGAMGTDKTCPPAEEKGQRVFLSGTKVREMLSNGEAPPAEFTRPEIAEILIKSMQPKS